MIANKHDCSKLGKFNSELFWGLDQVTKIKFAS